jgi:hypothetical protein
LQLIHTFDHVFFYKGNVKLERFIFFTLLIGEATTCTDRVESLQVRGIVFLDCANPSPAVLRSELKLDVTPACPGFNGYVSFKLSSFLDALYSVGRGQGWQLAPKVTIDGVSLNYPNSDFSYKEGSPVSPGIHYIKIEIGGCIFEFDVNVPENPTTLRFAGTNTNGENPSMCIYKRTCPGQGERDIVVPPFFDLSNNKTCVFPGFCEFEGIRAQVGNLVLGTKMLPAEMYRLLVKSEMDDTQDPVKRKLLADQLAQAENLPNCARVRFCEKTLIFQGHDPARWFIGNDNGKVFCEGTCTLVRCVDPVIGILGKIFSSCDHAPKHVPDGEECCPPGGKMVDVNLAQMAINYAQLTPAGLQEVYQANSNFQDSELEQILKTHIIPLFGTNPTKQSIIDKITQDFGDPRLKKLRCAKVTVCDNEFKLKGVERASNGSLPNPLDLVDDCGDNVISVPLDKFGKPSSDKFRRSFRVDLCEFHPDFLRDNPVPLESQNGLIGVFPCGKKEEKIGFFRVKKDVSDRIVRLFASTSFFSSEDVLIERKIISEQGITPQDSVVDSVFFDYKIKLQFDTIQSQTFQRLSTINSQGETRPDLLFSQNDSIKLYNYGHHLPSVFSLDRQNHLFTHEDWDEDRTYSILKSIPKKEVLLSIQDTSILAVTAISTDSLIKVQHFSKVDSSVYIAGHYFGHLYIGGRVFDSLPDYSRAKVFFIRFSRDGRLLDVATAGSLDTLSGIRFSENKHGVINWAAQALGDSVTVDTSVLGLSASNALLLGQYSITQGLRILNHSQGHDAFRIANVALSPALQESAIALVGVGAVDNTNGKPQLSSGSSLQVLRFNGQGIYFDALSCSLQNLNQQKIALTYGAENALALGLNYQSTINVFDTTLTSAGFEDFAIFKFKPNGDLHWVHDNGSLDQESINQLWYDNHNVLYFGGEMSGNLAETHTYGIYVFYDTTALGTQRVFLSAVLDTFYQTGITQFSELASINQPVVEIKKALPISFKAYPNPFQNQITAEFILDTPGEITLQLFNQLGNVVEVRKINANDGLNREQISTNSLPSGLYFLHLHDAQNRQIGVQKVLKM